METKKRVWFVLLIVSYMITIYMFLGQLNSENHMSYVIAPFLLLMGALNFVTDDPLRERKALNVQLFVIGSFAASYARIVIGSLRYYPRGVLSEIRPFIGLTLIVVFLALLKRSQEKPL